MISVYNFYQTLSVSEITARLETNIIWRQAPPAPPKTPVDGLCDKLRSWLESLESRVRPGSRICVGNVFLINLCLVTTGDTETLLHTPDQTVGERGERNCQLGSTGTVHHEVPGRV